MYEVQLQGAQGFSTGPRPGLNKYSLELVSGYLEILEMWGADWMYNRVSVLGKKAVHNGKKFGNISVRWYLKICSQKPIRSIFIWKNHSSKNLLDGNCGFFCRFLNQIRLQKTVFWTSMEWNFFSIQYWNILQFTKTFFDNMCVLSYTKSRKGCKSIFHDCNKKIIKHFAKKKF